MSEITINNLVFEIEEYADGWGWIHFDDKGGVVAENDKSFASPIEAWNDAARYAVDYPIMEQERLQAEEDERKYGDAESQWRSDYYQSIKL